MNNASSSQPPRRPLAVVNQIGTAQLHLRNPFVVAFWSALFPGFGHILLSQYPKGFVLFLWEIFINLKTHVNLALLYTLLGKFEMARGIVDLRWSLLYIPIYVFAIWDSYRVAVDLNKQYILAQREDAPVGTFFMNAFSVTYLNKRTPLVTAAWCAASPGLSHVMLHRLVHAVFLVFWWSVVVYKSNILTAIHLTCFGEFLRARAVIDPQWLLNIPSLLFFCVYVAYVNAVEGNKLFDREQSRFLRSNYQSAEFPYPADRADETGAGMYVVSIFKQSIEVELAVTALEEEGVSQKDLLAVPVDMAIHSRKLFDTRHFSTGDSLFDLAMILGTFLALLGCIYGYILEWGPVVWGVIGGAVGFGVGVFMKLLIIKRKKTTAAENEVVIFVSCVESKTEQVKRVLNDNGALGVSIVKGTDG